MTTTELTIPTALYELKWTCWDGCPPREHDCYEVVEHPVTRVTARRVYFRHGRRRYDTREHFVSRADLDTGPVFHGALLTKLHAQVPEVPRPPAPPSVAELRRAMAEAHPDRGGDPAEFREAHARYLAARGGAR